jgi:hypothetical protein
MLAPVKVSVPLPHLNSFDPEPEIVPLSVRSASVSKIGLLYSVTARAVVNAAVLRSVPPCKSNPPEAAPRLASAATCTMPCLITVPPL